MFNFKDQSRLGVILLAIGLGFLMVKFNSFGLQWLISNFWPLILVALGGRMLQQGGDEKQARTFIFVGLGLLFITWKALHSGFLGNVLPIALILIGAILLLRKSSLLPFNDEEEGKLNKLVLFGDAKVGGGNYFSGGWAFCAFGDLHLDLEQLQDIHPEAKLHLICLFGDIRVDLAKEMALASEEMAVFSDIRRKGDAEKEATAIPAHITGIFGDVNIRYP